MPTYDESVTITGSDNTTQLLVQGHTLQTEPLQQWQDSDENFLARLTGDGRLQIGSFSEGEMDTDDSLIEAHRAETDTAKPKRGFHLLGAINDTLSTAVSWVVHELVLKGTSGISALHTALRVRLRHEGTGTVSGGAESRGGDIEVINAGATGVVTGLRVGVGHETGATSSAVYGVKVELTDPPSGAYSVHTNAGKVRFGGLSTGFVRADGSGDLTSAVLTTADIPDEAVTLAKLADGTAYKYVGFDASGEATERDAIQVVAATWGEGSISARDAVYLKEVDNENKWYKIDADSDAPLVGRRRGFVLDAGTGAIGTSGAVIVYGLLGGFSGLTPGAPIYVTTTPGGIVQSRPSVSAGGAQVCLVELGWAVTSTLIMIDPKPVEYLMRKILATTLTNTLTIVHHSDPQGRRRQPSAYISSYNSVVAETYAESNQDGDLQLKGVTGSGATTSVDTSGASSYWIGDNGGTDYRVAQSFQVTTGRLSSFTVYAVSTTGSPSVFPTWSICADNGGIPGSMIATGVMASWGTSSNVTTTVTNGPILMAGTTYWLVLEIPTQATNNYYLVGRNSSGAYANGVMKTDSTTSAPFPGTWNVLSAGSDMRCSLVTSSVSTYERLAQGISHGSTATVASISLWLKKVGTPAATLTCAIYSDSGGNPGSAIANGTATVSTAALESSYGWVTFTFATPPSITGSTQYHIVLSSNGSQSNTDYVVWGIDLSSPSYANGAIKTESSSTWSATPTADGCFELYIQDTAYDEWAVVGRYSAGTRDLGVRYDNGANGYGDTNTTFKNVSGSTLDVTCVVRLD